jgi:threonine/homoserine/homoserine lactone efflux protein
MLPGGGHLAAFLVTIYVLILIPGPSVVFVVSRGVALGRRAAILTVLGNETGFAALLLLVAVGLGALLARSDAVFTVLKLAGAAYLVFLGIRAIRERGSISDGLRSACAEPPKSGRRVYREGVIVGLTNPKGLLIFSVIVPGFIDRAAGHDTLQLLTLGAITVAIALASDLVWAAISGSAREWLGRSPRRLERMSAGGGVAMIGLGVALAVTGHNGSTD